METQRTLHAADLFRVSWHVDQTGIVWILSQIGAIDADRAYNVEDPATGKPKPIAEWHLFTEFRETEYRRLVEAGVPLVTSQFGQWVGLVGNVDDYDDEIHPLLLKVLYGIDADGTDVRFVRMGLPAMGISRRVREAISAAAG